MTLLHKRTYVLGPGCSKLALPRGGIRPELSVAMHCSSTPLALLQSPALVLALFAGTLGEGTYARPVRGYHEGEPIMLCNSVILSNGRTFLDACPERSCLFAIMRHEPILSRRGSMFKWVLVTASSQSAKGEPSPLVRVGFFSRVQACCTVDIRCSSAIRCSVPAQGLKNPPRLLHRSSVVRDGPGNPNLL